ncbi:MAG TPA: PD-(D/E)XK motif protein [Bellilinea sp.]|nr:PD-(D/E)XK motif protein [Bellilinea sp.]
MEISEELESAWNELINESWSKPGRYVRRVASSSIHGIYVVLIRPSDAIGLALVLPSKLALAVSEDSAKGFVLTKEWREGSDKVTLTLSLTENRYREVFKILASDVFSRILKEKSQDGGALALVGRLSHWKRFLQATREEGLSIEEQLGLFGELFVLHSMLATKIIPPEDVLSAWHGPAGSNQDFLYALNAIEVKSTLSNDIARISISNERQLDETGLSQLLLVQLAFDLRPGSPMTLPAMIREIRDLLPEPVREQYYDLLALAGYYSIHESRYEERSYVLRLSRYFDVSGVFPRIRQIDLRRGLSDVRYVVDVSNIEPVADDLANLSDFLFAK